MMKPLLLSLGLCAMALPAAAQDAPAPKDDLREGVDLLGEGARRLFKGLIDGMEPSLQELGKSFAEMEPVLRDLASRIGDIRNYDAPETLPNGDILIRRKPGTLPPDQTKPAPEGEIEL